MGCRITVFKVIAHNRNRLSDSGFGLNDYYGCVWNDKFIVAICGSNPISFINPPAVRDRLA